MRKEYSLILKPIFMNTKNKEEYEEIKLLYQDTGDITLFNTISFMILDENRRIIESLVFPSFVLDNILNIVLRNIYNNTNKKYSVISYRLPLNSMMYKYEITFLVDQRYLIFRKYNFLNKVLANKYYIKFDNVYSE